MSKIKNGGLDQYGTEPFEQQQFGTAGVERVKFVDRDHHANHYAKPSVGDVILGKYAQTP